MERKSFKGFEVKDAEKGIVEAIFSTFGVVDHDGDVVMPGAFEDGKSVTIGAYNHGSVRGSMWPVGKGTISTTKKDARVTAQFFMDTTPGKDAFNAVKGMGEIQEWSYAFDVLEEAKPDREEFPGAFRILKKLDPFEISPVIRGASIGTRTLAAKDLDSFIEELKETVIPIRFQLVEEKPTGENEEKADSEEKTDPPEEGGDPPAGETDGSGEEEKASEAPAEEATNEEARKEFEREAKAEAERFRRNMERYT